LQLEDRTVPSYFPAGGPATHLQVIVPETVKANHTFDVIVEAEDASNQAATGYTGTVTFASSDTKATAAATDGSALGAVSALSYTFTAKDHGSHEFDFQLTTTNPTTITVTDKTDSFSNTATTNAAAAVATTLAVETPEQAATGVPTPVEVEVLDQAGQVMRNFTGAVTVSSSDGSATGTPGRHTAAASLPITYTFTARDHGEHTFLVTFSSTAATPATVTAATTTPALSGSAQLALYPPTTVTHFGVFAVPFAFSGTATPVVVEALNASDQVVSGYTGTVSFADSADTTATVSATKGGTATALGSFTYTFTTGTGNDNGKHTFWVTFDKTGPQALTVADTAAAALTNTVNVDVFAPPPPPKHHWL